MQRKQRGHHETASGVTGGAQQNPEQQDRVHHMQQQVDVMMPGWIELEDLAIQGMR